MLKPAFEKLVERGVHVFIITRTSHEHDAMMADQSEAGICYFEALGVQVLLVKGGHHRKLAMIDRSILWEGSLNILSQSNSREIMRRIDDKIIALEMISFLKFDKLL
jgi:phosphatidylserine/phosphatidylglycerophosphate/cardiolipin synthase-like enzyme